MYYPGLAGSMWFHADIDCDNDIDWDDEGYLLWRISYACCDDNCGYCLARGDDESDTPATMAARLAEQVPGEELPIIADAAGGLAVSLTDPDRRAFWSAVHDLLSE
jgi:hypothetical protein